MNTTAVGIPPPPPRCSLQINGMMQATVKHATELHTLGSAVPDIA
jgi:hypothetical protein